MSTRMITSVVVAVGVASSTGYGEYPNEIHHQGVIAVHGERFDGQGEFYFSLVDELGYNLWTNDGTNVGTSQPPDSPVPLTVVNGVYRVRLGNTDTQEPPTTTPIPRAVFNENDNVALRIWFDDGVNGIHQLTPDQVLTGAPYAQRLPNVFVDESTGHVGVGTADPLAPLAVQGAASRGDQMRVHNPEEAHFAAFGVDEASNLYIQTHEYGVGAAGDVILQGGFPDHAYAGGNVGIGTNAPNFRLHLKANGSDGVKIQGSGTGYPQLRWTDENDDLKAAVAVDTAAPQMNFFVGGADRMAIDEDGHVGIGATAPTAKLHVGGTPGVDGIKFPNDTLQTTAAKAHALDTEGGEFEDLVHVDGHGNVSIGSVVEYDTPVVDQQNLVGDLIASDWHDGAQSFTAEETGSLTSIRVWVSCPAAPSCPPPLPSLYSVDLEIEIHEGSDTSGPLLGDTTALYTIEADGVVLEDPLALEDITVVAGETYTWSATVTALPFCSPPPVGGGLYYGSGDPYPGGQADIAGADYVFETTVAHPLSATDPAVRVTSEGRVYVPGGSDTSLASGGSLIIGSLAGDNISIDANAIMARDGGTKSTLYLNNKGGNVITGSGYVGIGTADPKAKLDVNGPIKPRHYGLSTYLYGGGTTVSFRTDGGPTCNAHTRGSVFVVSFNPEGGIQEYDVLCYCRGTVDTGGNWLYEKWCFIP